MFVDIPFFIWQSTMDVIVHWHRCQFFLLFAVSHTCCMSAHMYAYDRERTFDNIEKSAQEYSFYWHFVFLIHVRIYDTNGMVLKKLWHWINNEKNSIPFLFTELRKKWSKLASPETHAWYSTIGGTNTVFHYWWHQYAKTTISKLRHPWSFVTIRL